MKENVAKDKSFAFAIGIVKLYKYLVEEKREFVFQNNYFVPVLLLEH